MLNLRILLPTVLLFGCVLLQAQKKLDTLSQQVSDLNHEAFNLKDNNPIKAKRLNDQAFILLKKGKVDPIVKSDTYSVIGNLEFQKGNYSEALRHFITSLKIREKTNDYGKIADMNLNVANTCYYACFFKKAIPYYKRCEQYYKKLQTDKLEYIPIYNGLSQVYESESVNKPDSASYYYMQALNIVDQLKDKNHQYVSVLYSNLGQRYTMSEEYDKALAYYNKALDIQKSFNDQYGMGWIYHHMGIVSDYRQNSAEAKGYFHKAEKLAVDQSDLETQRDICESWMYLYTREKKPDSVAYYFERYKDLSDKINKQKTSKDLIEIEAKYQTEKKDQQLKLSQEENKLQQAQKNSMILGFTLGAIIIVTVFYFLIRNYRQKQRIATMQVDLKNKEINELLSQQETASYAAMLEGQDHERFRIAQDLHDRLGSTLAAIKLGMQGDPVSTNGQNQQLVDTAITEVRAIAHNLSGGNIERYGLNAALNELKTTLERSGKMRVNLYLEQVPAGNQLSIELYRIIQELVSNTLKHANANEITIQTNDHLDNLNLIYEDNGSGFEPSASGQGMGLRNIHLRLKKWGGTLEIDTQPKRGTIVIINVPKNTAP